MPTATFEDKDLIETITRETGCKPDVIVKKYIEDGKLKVFWR